ncbi:MAG: ribonuclease III [Bacteroidia bacterium]|nr:ribonuclease III [Bacteroidia bacterium]MCX7764734.1 ribonuclease III [Bacteroidia bacterium]MDW8057321.1 ribonuclease III [Bacteroidia bacterium]
MKIWWERLFGPHRREYKRYRALIGAWPCDLSWYRSAFTLPSSSQSRESYLLHSYERLEFLGDAVLQLVITDYIFRHYSHFDEGEMTELRAKVVNTEFLIEIAQRLKLSELILTDPALLPKRQDYLADMVEALIGAIYIDLGYKSAYRFIRRKVFPFISWSRVEATEFNYKGKLLELVQQKQLGQVEFVVQERRRTARGEVFLVRLRLNGKEISTGTGLRKKEAEQAAARAALKLLKD